MSVRVSSGINSQLSRRFFRRMFVVFLLLTDPASRKANPHCMTISKHKIVLAQAGSEKPLFASFGLFNVFVKHAREVPCGVKILHVRLLVST